MGISTTLYNGLSGLNSFGTAVSVVSDNVANAGTTAYKSNSVRFGDLVNNYFAAMSHSNEAEGIGSNILGLATDYAQGLMLDTTNWSDLAVNGEGFFIVNKVAGSGTAPSAGLPYYTRDGSFHLDGNGYLINLQGYRVQGYVGGATGTGYTDVQIANPENYASIRIETDGQIVAIDQNGAEVQLARIALATFTNKNGLVRQGGNLYITGPEVGQTLFNTEFPELFGLMEDFSIESSNVDLAKEMVDMIIFQASYNANSKSITTGSQMLDTSINMVR